MRTPCLLNPVPLWGCCLSLMPCHSGGCGDFAVLRMSLLGFIVDAEKEK